MPTSDKDVEGVYALVQKFGIDVAICDFTRASSSFRKEALISIKPVLPAEWKNEVKDHIFARTEQAKGWPGHGSEYNCSRHSSRMNHDARASWSGSPRTRES